MTERYQSVNGAWPQSAPALTAQEAVAAAKRLYRLVMRKPWIEKIKVTSGNRRGAAVRYGMMIVNPDAGWKGLVHSLSHRCHYRLHPGHKPHDGRGTHAFIERTMIEHVVNSGWLEGKLKRPNKPKAEVDVKVIRAKRVAARIKAWEAKRKRAETALRKLARMAAYYERQLAA